MNYSGAPATAAAMPLVSLLPAETTLAAKLRVPIRESSSRLEQVERVALVSREWCMSWSLSEGRRASREAESRTMPRCSRQVVGPSHLSSASRTPRAAQGEVRVCRWCVHCSESGVPATNKSSR